MSGLREVILEVLEAAPQNRVTMRYLVDQVDLQGEDFSVSELDETVEELVEDGVVRVRNPRAPLNDRLVELVS
jgi:Fe2+ or Zn2+ uptake regulation protein